MPTKHADLFDQLAAQFDEKEVKSYSKSGTTLWYVTARTVMNRMDSVLGPENWWDEYVADEKSVTCRLTIRLPDGSTLTKCDAGGRAGMKDTGDDEKSGFSDAFKRAAVKHGIGRYLYRDGTPHYGHSNEGDAPEPQERREKPQETPGQWLVRWAKKHGHVERLNSLALSFNVADPADLTKAQAKQLHELLQSTVPTSQIQGTQKPQAEAAPPPPAVKPAAPERDTRGRNANGNPEKFGWPATGVAFFRWMKNLEQSFRLEDKLKESCLAVFAPRFGNAFTKWSPEQVQEAALHVAGLIRMQPGYSGEWNDRLPPLVDLNGLRDDVWSAVVELNEAMGGDPSTENIEIALHGVNQSVMKDHGGEMIEGAKGLTNCTNVPLMQAIIRVCQSDTGDAAAFAQKSAAGA